MVERDSNYILLAVPAINASFFPLYLPEPSLANTGGYRFNNKGEIVAQYSPIDIAICGMTALYYKEQSVTSLNDWFIKNPFPIGKAWVTCTISITTNKDLVINTLSISEWELLCKHNSKLYTLLKKNAPFTFRTIS